MTTVKKIAEITVPAGSYPPSKLTVLAPEGAAKPLPVVLFIHGGGWCMGCAADVEYFAAEIAKGGYIVANADYSLAPEYVYPASIVQTAAALDYIYENAGDFGGDKDRIFIGGNSSGGHLSAMLGAMVANRDLAAKVGYIPRTPAAAVRGLILINGVFDMDTAGACGFPGFETFVGSFTGCADYRDFPRLDELSAIKHLTPDFPPAFITAGDIDPLEPQSMELAAELKRRGADYVGLFHTGSGSGLDHDYVFDLATDASKTAFALIFDFMARHA